VLNYGTILMTGASSISEQGAVSNPGTLTMNGSSSIHHNVAVAPVTDYFNKSLQLTPHARLACQVNENNIV
jgi:hypothetical protein